MQKRAAQSGDARNDDDEMARVVATAAAGNDQLPRCWGCLVVRALLRRDKCVKCHAKLSDLKRSVYRVERVVDSWRTKVDPLGGKVHRDRNALNSLRLVASVAAVTNGKRLLQYSHNGNK
jgi:hypothetical protein